MLARLRAIAAPRPVLASSVDLIFLLYSVENGASNSPRAPPVMMASFPSSILGTVLKASILTALDVLTSGWSCSRERRPAFDAQRQQDYAVFRIIAGILHDNPGLFLVKN